MKIDTTERLLQEVEGKVWTAVITHSDLNKIKKQFTIGNIIQKSDGVEVRIVGDQKPGFPCEPVRPILKDKHVRRNHGLVVPVELDTGRIRVAEAAVLCRKHFKSRLPTMS